MKLRKNDLVKIIAGAHKGKTGKIIQVLPRENKVVVDGVNMRVRHMKSRRKGEPGRKIEFFAPIDASNVAFLLSDGKITRLGVKTLADGSRVRVAARTKETISQ